METPISRLSSVSVLQPSVERYASSVMASGLDYLNGARNTESLGWRNDRIIARGYYAVMASPRHDWYFKQWLDYFGLVQADVVKALEWNKSKASLMFNDKQRYHRDDVNQVAALLNIEPFELLIPPARAMALRQYRANAETIVTLAHSVEEEAEAARTGTDD